MSEPNDAPSELADLQQDLSIEIGRESEFTTAQQMATATIVMRKLAGIQRDIDLITETERLEISSIQGMAERELAPLQRRAKELEDYVEMLARLIQWPKRKASHDTPFGTFGVRKVGASVNLVDDEKALAYALDHAPECVETVPALLWGRFKATIDPNAEALPDGVERVAEQVNPYVKLA